MALSIEADILKFFENQDQKRKVIQQNQEYSDTTLFTQRHGSHLDGRSKVRTLAAT